MMAAIWAAKKGSQVLLLEKNERLGKKLFITGKGRCNLTNGCEIEELFSSVVTNHRFLYSAFYSFSNQDTIEFFEKLGLPLKKERGNRIFPVSDHSSDVIRALSLEMERLGVEVRLNTEIERVLVKDGVFRAVVLKGGITEAADSLIVATGGLSYPSTGSTGDGYEWAKALGHTVTDLSPSLVPVHIKESCCKEMMGLSLRNVGFRAFSGKKKIYEENSVKILREKKKNLHGNKDFGSKNNLLNSF